MRKYIRKLYEVIQCTACSAWITLRSRQKAATKSKKLIDFEYLEGESNPRLLYPIQRSIEKGKQRGINLHNLFKNAVKTTRNWRFTHTIKLSSHTHRCMYLFCCCVFVTQSSINFDYINVNTMVVTYRDVFVYITLCEKSFVAALPRFRGFNTGISTQCIDIIATGCLDSFSGSSSLSKRIQSQH